MRGRRTGARAYQVVRQHGGEIEPDSREGQGTTFSVWLPLSGAVHGRGQHQHVNR